MRNYIELILLLAQKDLKIRYKNSFLGYLWAIANPLAFALVYFIAFKLIMKVSIPEYLIFLLAGMFPWLWLSNGIINTTRIYKNNISLVKKVNLNRMLLPMGSVVYETIHFCFSLPVLILFVYLNNGCLFYSWLWQIPTLILVQFLLIFSTSLILALINVFIQDIEYIVGIVFSLLFYFTPIVYSIDMIPNDYLYLFNLNPLIYLINSWRDVILNGDLVLSKFFFLIGLIFFISLISIIVYKKLSFKIGELL